MRTIIRVTAVAGLAAALLAGCATAQPPEELREARVEYRQATGEETSQLAAEELRQAKLALEEAEQAWLDGDDDEARRHASDALKRIKVAEARADMLRRRGEQVATEEPDRWFREDMAGELEEPATRGSEDVRQRREQVQAERGVRSPRGRLEMVARLEDEPRGVRIVIPSEALFLPDEAGLVAGSQLRLDRVVDYVEELPWETLRVEVHTDSRGAAAFNQELSDQRATAVRTYLVTHGVPGERVTAEGRGESEPLATNATSEGRAENQRVEILAVVPKIGEPQKAGSGDAPSPLELPNRGVPPSEDRPHEPDRSPRP